MLPPRVSARGLFEVTADDVKAESLDINAAVILNQPQLSQTLIISSRARARCDQ